MSKLSCTKPRGGEVPCAAPQETGLCVPHVPAELCLSRIPAGCAPARFIPLCEQFQPRSTHWCRGNISMSCHTLPWWQCWHFAVAAAGRCPGGGSLPKRDCPNHRDRSEAGTPCSLWVCLVSTESEKSFLTKKVTQHTLQQKLSVPINRCFLLFSSLLGRK